MCIKSETVRSLIVQYVRDDCHHFWSGYHCNTLKFERIIYSDRLSLINRVTMVTRCLWIKFTVDRNGYKCTSINLHKLLNLFIKISNIFYLMNSVSRLNLLSDCKPSYGLESLMLIWKCIPPALCGSLQHAHCTPHAPRNSNTCKTISEKRCREGTFLVSAWLYVIK